MKFAFAIALACVAATAAIAQQAVPFRNNIPVAPSGIPTVPYRTSPWCTTRLKVNAFAWSSSRVGCRTHGAWPFFPAATCS